MTIYVGDVYHTDVHADVACIGGFLPVDETIGFASSEMPVPTVGVAYGDCCYAAGACELAPTAVAYGFGGWDVVNLEYGGLEGGDVVEGLVVAGIDAVETEAESYHVHLAFGEVFYAGGIVDVAQDVMAEVGLEVLGSYLVSAVLLGRETVKLIVVAAYKVGEDTAWD